MHTQRHTNTDDQKKNQKRCILRRYQDVFVSTGVYKGTHHLLKKKSSPGITEQVVLECTAAAKKELGKCLNGKGVFQERNGGWARQNADQKVLLSGGKKLCNIQSQDWFSFLQYLIANSNSVKTKESKAESLV